MAVLLANTLEASPLLDIPYRTLMRPGSPFSRPFASGSRAGVPSEEARRPNRGKKQRAPERDRGYILLAASSNPIEASQHRECIEVCKRIARERGVSVTAKSGRKRCHYTLVPILDP